MKLKIGTKMRTNYTHASMHNNVHLRGIYNIYRYIKVHFVTYVIKSASVSCVGISVLGTFACFFPYNKQHHICDVICEKGPYCGRNIVGPDQTPRMMRGV